MWILNPRASTRLFKTYGMVIHNLGKHMGLNVSDAGPKFEPGTVNYGVTMHGYPNTCALALFGQHTSISSQIIHYLFPRHQNEQNFCTICVGLSCLPATKCVGIPQGPMEAKALETCILVVNQTSESDPVDRYKFKVHVPKDCYKLLNMFKQFTST